MLSVYAATNEQIGNLLSIQFNLIQIILLIHLVTIG